jgi:hypothetical protein
MLPFHYFESSFFMIRSIFLKHRCAFHISCTLKLITLFSGVGPKRNELR